MKAFIEDTIRGINTIEEKSSASKCIDWFNSLSVHPDSEIKLYKSDIEEYQIYFNWKGINKWKVDSPLELNKIHKQCYASKKQCIAIIKELYQVKNIDNIPGFIDVPIRHFTLDEMLEFKQEDEIMLRGNDPDQNPDSAIQKTASKPKEVAPVKSASTTPSKKTSIKKPTPVTPKKKEPISKTVPVKKTKPKTSITMGENLNAKKAKPTPKKVTPKIAKEKPKDDSSFFQI